MSIEQPAPRDRLTAAPAPIVFADGVEYRMSPLTDRDIVELDEWVRVHYVRIVVSSMPSDAPPEKVEEARLAASSRAMSMTWLSGEGARLLATVEGMTRLLWQGIRANHPSVTVEDLRRHMFSPENVAEVRRKFAALNSATSRGEGEKKGSRVKRRRRHGRRYTEN